MCSALLFAGGSCNGASSTRYRTTLQWGCERMQEKPLQKWRPLHKQPRELRVQLSAWLQRTRLSDQHRRLHTQWVFFLTQLKQFNTNKINKSIATFFRSMPQRRLLCGWCWRLLLQLPPRVRGRAVWDRCGRVRQSALQERRLLQGLCQQLCLWMSTRL